MYKVESSGNIVHFYFPNLRTFLLPSFMFGITSLIPTELSELVCKRGLLD